MVSPRSLANLKPLAPGQSGNPSGKSSHPRRIPVQNSLLRTLDKIELSKEFLKDMRGKGPVIDRMWMAWCARWMKLMNKANTPEQFRILTEAMVKMHAIADDKEGPPIVELTGGGSGELTNKKESRVYLVGGEVTKREEIQTLTATQTVELTGGEDGTDHGSK